MPLKTIEQTVLDNEDNNQTVSKSNINPIDELPKTHAIAKQLIDNYNHIINQTVDQLPKYREDIDDFQIATGEKRDQMSKSAIQQIHAQFMPIVNQYNQALNAAQLNRWAIYQNNVDSDSVLDSVIGLEVDEKTDTVDFNDYLKFIEHTDTNLSTTYFRNSAQKMIKAYGLTASNYTQLNYYQIIYALETTLFDIYNYTFDGHDNFEHQLGRQFCIAINDELHEAIDHEEKISQWSKRRKATFVDVAYPKIVKSLNRILNSYTRYMSIPQADKWRAIIKNAWKTPDQSTNLTQIINAWLNGPTDFYYDIWDTDYVEYADSFKQSKAGQFNDKSYQNVNIANFFNVTMELENKLTHIMLFVD